jgi:hypothetical protein
VSWSVNLRLWWRQDAASAETERWCDRVRVKALNSTNDCRRKREDDDKRDVNWKAMLMASGIGMP